MQDTKHKEDCTHTTLKKTIPIPVHHHHHHHGSLFKTHTHIDDDEIMTMISIVGVVKGMGNNAILFFSHESHYFDSQESSDSMTYIARQASWPNQYKDNV
jgi:hypothetical protein